MSKQRAKGTAAETAVVKWLREQGFRYAERRALHGSEDQGDITGIPGVVIEVKNHKALDLAGWLAELDDEMDNASASVGAVIAKKRGTTDVNEWYCVMPARIFAELLRDAGWR